MRGYKFVWKVIVEKIDIAAAFLFQSLIET